MKSVSLSGSLRENVGKKDARSHRKSGHVPCVMYGGKEQIHFVINEKELAKAMHTPVVHIFKLTIGGKEFPTIVQDVQYHPVTDRLLHVDFKEIIADKPVTIGIPIHITGTAPGVLRGGKMAKKMRKLTVKALSQHLPDEISVSIDGLEIGQAIKVSDMTLDNVTFLDPQSNVIVAVQTARSVVEETGPGAEGAAAEAEKK
jgi:large subunit ribosomal protein L25